jgi:pimeloyl-ACP methyl ester carboxylesterase
MLSWDAEFCAILAAGTESTGSRYVIRYDHRDTGRSVCYPVGQPGYDLPELADDALALLDSLELAEAHLVGISMGGMLAQLIALEQPGRVSSLALLSSSPGAAGPGQSELPPASLALRLELDDLDLPDWQDRASVIDYLLGLDRLLASDSRPFDEPERRRIASATFDRATDRPSFDRATFDRPSFDRAGFDREGVALACAANHQLIEHGPAWRGRLGRITAPTLVVHGARDRIYPLAHGAALAAEIPGARLLVLPDTGHELARADWPALTTALLRHTSRP